MLIFLKKNYNRYFSSEKNFVKHIHQCLNYVPSSIIPFRIALTHKSISQNADDNNERLEYIGDAILDCVIAEYLFKRYPGKSEGYLTQMRSKMVNRKRLHHAALNLGLDTLMLYSNQINVTSETNSALGDALEAVIGAIFLDSNYETAKRFIVQQIIKPIFNIEEIEREEISPKNKLLSWASKNRNEIIFKVENEVLMKNNKIFTISVLNNGLKVADGKAFNKKDAEQLAAAEAITKLGI